MKTAQPTLLTALVSGYLSVETAVAATRAGADLIKFKPVSFREVLRAFDDAPTPVEDLETPSLARSEWEHIHRVLADSNGNISEAARRLGIFRASLHRKLKRLAPRV